VLVVAVLVVVVLVVAVFVVAVEAASGGRTAVPVVISWTTVCAS